MGMVEGLGTLGVGADVVAGTRGVDSRGGARESLMWGLTSHTTTDGSWRGARPSFGGLRTGFAGLGGVGPRVKHEDDGGGAERTFEAMTKAAQEGACP